MSSPKPARKTPRRTSVARAGRAAVKLAAANDASASAEAKRLAADMERALAGGQLDLLDLPALQALMAATCRTYAAKVEAGEEILPLSPHGATATDVMLTASGLLKSSNLAVFELGMWQSCTGR